MTVRATEAVESTLINDLIALRDAERVICRMTHEEIMTRMKLGLFDDYGDQYYVYVADYEDTLEEHSLYAEILLGVRSCEEGVELVPEIEGLEGFRLRIYAAPRHQGNWEVDVIASHWRTALFVEDEGKEVAAASDVAAILLVMQSETHTLSAIQEIARRVLKALF